MCFHSGLSLFGDDFLTVMSVVYTIFYLMSADLYRKLTEVEELERQAKFLERCKDKFVYKRPPGISLFFREPIALAKSENKKELEVARRREKESAEANTI